MPHLGAFLVKEITSEQAAYIAGIIDGEGTIGIAKGKDTKAKRGISYRLFVSVANTDHKLLDWLQQTDGAGTIVFNDRSSFNKKWSPIWKWTISSCASAQLLNRILPWLVMKKPQAELALEFYSRLDVRSGNGCLGLTENQYEYRTAAYEKMRSLKTQQSPLPIQEGILTQEKYAYLAGIVDGEGCISIVRRKTYRGNRRPVYNSMLMIANTQRCLIDWLQRATGFDGSVYVQKTRKAQHRPCWNWTIRMKRCGAMLQNILPYLVIKADQAKLALEFNSRARRSPGSIGLNEGERAYQRWAYETMKSMKKKHDAAASSCPRISRGHLPLFDILIPWKV